MTKTINSKTKLTKEEKSEGNKSKERLIDKQNKTMALKDEKNGLK